MLNDVVEFLPDIQSINPTEKTGFVLFCTNDKEAVSAQYQLLHDFDIPSVLDIDDYGARYVVPLESPDKNLATDFIRRGWSFDRDQPFVQYLITLYTEDAANKIYNMLVAGGYNVAKSPNNMQLVVNFVADSKRDTIITELKSKLEEFEKSSPKSIDDYFNRILFNGVIESPEYRKVREQEFSSETIEQNRDLIIREIVYRYFNTIICAHLTCPKFDANKLNNETIQNINLIRDFLYSVAKKYIDTQIETANTTRQQPIIRFDYLKTCKEYNRFKKVLKPAKNWRPTNKRNARIEQHHIRMSQRWTYKIMDLNDGFYVVHLGAQEALDYENRKLKHGTEIYYNEDPYEGISRYSIRQGYTPLVTLTTHNDQIIKCCGYNNTVPTDNKLREAVRTFIREYQLTIPDNRWNPLIAYIKQDGTVYDVFDLPAGFILNDTLNLENMGLDKLPNMPTVTINRKLLAYKNNLSNLDGAPYKVLGDCDFSQNPLESLRGMPRKIGGLVLLSGHKLNAESFVPLYIEDKLKKHDILGVDKSITAAWQDQIKQRKTSIANILSALRERKN